MIAAQTRQGKILGNRLSTMFFGNDVIDLKTRGIAGTRHKTIFANAASALPDEILQRFIHDGSTADAVFFEIHPGFGLQDSQQVANSAIVFQSVKLDSR